MLRFAFCSILTTLSQQVWIAPSTADVCGGLREAAQRFHLPILATAWSHLDSLGTMGRLLGNVPVERGICSRSRSQLHNTLAKSLS